MTKIVTLSFDDGFEKSSLITADIHEKYGLMACINIIANGHNQGKPGKGDFKLWNALKKRGHEIMPHSYEHLNKKDMPFEQAVELFEKCLHVFENELEGFDRSQSVYNFPFNVSTPELDEWLHQRMLGVRCDVVQINPLPTADTWRITSGGAGPENVYADLKDKLEAFVASDDDGWLVYNMHGIADEGYGPIEADELDSILAWLCSLDDMHVLPSAEVLKRRGTF
ncbi:MAG: polysaccharide deacetylase family protein [Planctomycetes bacterium]|nr:polysaccharide deacetylase family protein [Planctomycetota bacterium]